jgi:predicted Rossmann fold flavoprotein
MPWDVVIAGAGAAGLLAAICAAERGRRTLVCEKNQRPGTKILMSGGTRCNLSHATDSAGIVRAFGRQGRFLHSALASLSPEQTLTLFHTEGLRTKVEEKTGKIFPASDRAADVLAALMRRLHRSGAELAFGDSVREIEGVPGSMRVTTNNRTLTAESVIVTTGGRSYPGCGTTGDGYAWAAQFGHDIIAPRPALTPILCDARWIQELSGVTIPDVATRVVVAGRESGAGPVELPRRRTQKALAEARGSLLFAHFGLTGPAALDVSRAVSGASEAVCVLCDFLPDESADKLFQRLDQQCSREGGRLIGGLFAELLPRRLLHSLLGMLEIPVDRRAAEVRRADRVRIVEQIKGCRIAARGVMGFRKAEVTAGGVDLRQVDSSTMQSKVAPGLFFAGEVLDLDGPIGGFNFQAAFSTGWLAGSHA